MAGPNRNALELVILINELNRCRFSVGISFVIYTEELGPKNELNKLMTNIKA
ncbi:hypothetical protein Elgi_49470 [Paenibacillus elgii]|nr:hypothetical protein Elgi_49470 [Paenibacillus elgii]